MVFSGLLHQIWIPSIFCLASYPFCDTHIIHPPSFLPRRLPSLLPSDIFSCDTQVPPCYPTASHTGHIFHQPLPRYCSSTLCVRLRSGMPLSTAADPDSNRYCHVTMTSSKFRGERVGCRRLVISNYLGSTQSGTASCPRFSRNN